MPTIHKWFLKKLKCVFIANEVSKKTTGWEKKSLFATSLTRLIPRIYKMFKNLHQKTQIINRLVKSTDGSQNVKYKCPINK